MKKHLPSETLVCVPKLDDNSGWKKTQLSFAARVGTGVGAADSENIKKVKRASFVYFV